MNDAIKRLKDWRIWLGSTLVLSFQALLSFNLQLHSGNRLLHSSGEWINEAGTVFLWYLPAILLAPLLVALAPVTRFSENSWLSFTVQNIIFVLAATFAIQLSAMSLMYFGLQNSFGQPDFLATINYFYRNTPWHADVLLVIALFALGYSLDFSTRLRAKELQAQRLKTDLVNAELTALKSQLNPHFLFNVLNGISGLIRTGRNDEATDSLSDLSQMLRTILENRDQDLVSVKNEVAFIELYLALQKMRFRDKLQVDIQVDEQALPLKIPFMVLQPLVENAIQHGAQLEQDGNLIKLTVTRREEQLQIELFNRVPEKEAQGGFGIGIGNNRKRLNRIYQNAYSLELLPQPDRYYLTRLVIPVEENHA